jgi:hypothetical protein
MRRLFNIHSYLLIPWLLFVAIGARGANIDGTYVGRYQCGQWNTVELRITDHGNGRISGVFTFPLIAVQRRGRGNGSYNLIGSYDATSGNFRLDPQSWIGRAPAGYTMVGLAGTLDPATGKITGRIANPMCGAFELALTGAKGANPLPKPLPFPQSPQIAAAPATIPGYSAPERRYSPTNVTGQDHDFEYLDSTMTDALGPLRESQPIDDEIDWLKENEYSCVSTRHVIWQGNKGTVIDQVSVTERFAIECDGNCKGVRYSPRVNAIVVHLGLTQPVPVLQIKSAWLGGVQFQWQFTKPDDGQPAPEIFIHSWTQGSFNSGEGCSAPLSNPVPVPPVSISTSPSLPSPTPNTLQPTASIAARRPPSPAVPAYARPSSGRLTYNGPAVPQNGEIVFNNLPPGKLIVLYDRKNWEARIVAVDNGTQRVILRSKKSGAQNKAEVTWSISN